MLTKVLVVICGVLFVCSLVLMFAHQPIFGTFLLVFTFILASAVVFGGMHAARTRGGPTKEQKEHIAHEIIHPH